MKSYKLFFVLRKENNANRLYQCAASAGKIHQGATLIDVRSQAEYKIQHIEGSLSLPLEELQIAQLSKQESLIFSCLSGMRTENYVDALANLAAEGQEVFLLGAIFIATAAISFCPIWRLLGISTCKKSD